MASRVARAPTFSSFADFYPFYLAEHSSPGNRRLHVVGTSAALALLATSVARRDGGLALLVPLVGYGCAWFGHFVVERNRPATFRHPVYSLMGDLRMWWETVTLRRRF